MDAIKAVRFYVERMVTGVPGMKVLLLDDETTPVISVVATQSYLLAHEVYLIDNVRSVREPMKHLKCVCFLRPTAESIQGMIQELQNPSYGEYYIFFTNTVLKASIERLAEADEHEVVKEVQEYFADFLALGTDLFACSWPQPPPPIYGDNSKTWNPKALQRTSQCVLSVLLSLKRRPLVRYDRQSALAKRLADEVHAQMQQETSLFDFRRTEVPPILLILDRRSDPLTPLLNQWTYQAMVHELLGIHNGRVDLSRVPDIKPELKEVVLNPEHDPFYKKNMFLDLGELGNNIKTYVDEFQSKHKSTTKLESIGDMKRFVEEYPEFKKLGGNVSKHVSLVSELSRQVGQGCLLEVGELEQNLAVAESHTQDLKSLMALLENPKVSEDSKVRLAMLYALRYEKMPGNATPQIIDKLFKTGVNEKKVALIATLIRFAGADQRQEDIFENENFLAKSKNLFKGLKGVENVYTQHRPHLSTIVDQLVKGKLKDQSYPFVDGGFAQRPQDVIIFYVGGTTYAEAREVSKLMAANPGLRLLLGGTTIHNSRSFLAEMTDAVARWTPAPRRPN